MVFMGQEWLIEASDEVIVKMSLQICMEPNCLSDIMSQELSPQ